MYYRITHLAFDPNKYDALMAHANSVKDQMRAIEGLIFTHMFRTGEDELGVVARWESLAALEAGQQEINNVMGGMAQFLTSTPKQEMGEVIWRTDD